MKRNNSQVDALRGMMLCIVIVATALAYSFRFTSFLHAKEAVLCIGLCLIALLLVVRGRFSWRGLLPYIPLWLLLAYSVVVYLLFSKAHVLSLSTEEIIRCFVLLSIAACVYDLLEEEKWQRRILNTIIFSSFLVALLGVLQYARLLPWMFPEFKDYPQRVYSVFGNQDLYGGYVAIGIPFLLYRLLKDQRINLHCLTGLAVLIPGLLVSGSRSAWLAAAIGTVVIMRTGVKDSRKLIFDRSSIIKLFLISFIVVLTVLMAPQATVKRIRSTFGPDDVGGNTRLWIWDGTLRMIADRPFVGVGPGNYPYWSPRYLGEAIHAPGGEKHYHNELHAQHAHCDPMELVAETGIVGLLLCLWMLIRLLRCRGTEWAGITVLLIFSLFNAPFHSAPHALCFLLLAAILWSKNSVSESPSYFDKETFMEALLMCCMAVLLTAFVLWAVLIPSYLLRAAEDAHIANKSPFNLYARSERHSWPNATAYEEHGIALLDAGRNNEAKQRFLHALKGIDTGQPYLALGIIADRQGDKSTAKIWLYECIKRWPSNNQAWSLLIKNTAPAFREPIFKQADRWVNRNDIDRF